MKNLLRITGFLGVCLFSNAAAVAEDSLRELVSMCDSCHGRGGASQVPMVPSIGGLPEIYLHEALGTFQDGLRPCPEMQFWHSGKSGPVTDMCKIANQLNYRQVDALAQWYSERPFVPAKQVYDAELARRGRYLHVVLCESCHSDGGSLPDADAGVLAGQWMPYLQAVLMDFRNGGRTMIDDMAASFDKLEAADYEALVHYYASQQSDQGE